MKRFGETNNIKSKQDVLKPPEEELQFILWKAELNKELIAFWKSMFK